MIPVVIFAYERPDHLSRLLASLQADGVPKIFAFSDGPKTPEAADRVRQVRDVLRSVDWCDIAIIERPTNLGLGTSILMGVADVLSRHDAALVFEDDLFCVKGTYAYLTAALDHYRDDQRVMSVTGWTHPRVTPRGLSGQPYFDGRAESWSWGTWARAWQGMDSDALTLLRQCRERGIDPSAHGSDLVSMAETERARNIWAVRFLLLHLLRGGLCLRPPHALVDNLGFDEMATNTLGDEGWAQVLQPSPNLPWPWPTPREHPDCARLWVEVTKPVPPWATLSTRIVRYLRRRLGKIRDVTRK